MMLSNQVHTPRLFQAIESAMPRGTAESGELAVFGAYVREVANRASQLNDPILNALMVKLTLYDLADPDSEHHDPDLVKRIMAGESGVRPPFGLAMLAHRRRINKSQREAAEILGVALPTYSRWELGKITPDEITQEGAIARLEKIPTPTRTTEPK